MQIKIFTIIFSFILHLYATIVDAAILNIAKNIIKTIKNIWNPFNFENTLSSTINDSFDFNLENNETSAKSANIYIYILLYYYYNVIIT